MAKVLFLGALAAAIMLFGAMLVVAIAPFIAGTIAVWLVLLVIARYEKDNPSE